LIEVEFFSIEQRITSRRAESGSKWLKKKAAPVWHRLAIHLVKDLNQAIQENQVSQI
jgi:hypothetical protein